MATRIMATRGVRESRGVYIGQVCGNHGGARNLLLKALRAGYYWPTLEQDAKAIVHTMVTRLRGTITNSPGTTQFAIVIIDYSTKWIEAEPFATIKTEKVINFLWRNLYCWFGVPHAIIIDNGIQFDNNTFQEFLAKQGTTIFYASPAHPQTNGQVEAKLEETHGIAKGLWAAKIPEVLWTLLTTLTTATGESSYLLSYGTEAVIPIELTMEDDGGCKQLASNILK
ncbi:hypothetical protein ACLB2K_066119 [Fragaria x ananassa]